MRSTTLGLLASPGIARPVRSPLTSAMKHGTPAFDSCPAISCSVLVLPVPVAPAIRPWRLRIEKATWMRASLYGTSLWSGLPSSRAGSLSAYPAVMAVDERVGHGCDGGGLDDCRGLGGSRGRDWLIGHWGIGLGLIGHRRKSLSAPCNQTFGLRVTARGDTLAA